MCNVFLFRTFVNKITKTNIQHFLNNCGCASPVYSSTFSVLFSHYITNLHVAVGCSMNETYFEIRFLLSPAFTYTHFYLQIRSVVLSLWVSLQTPIFHLALMPEMYLILHTNPVALILIFSVSHAVESSNNWIFPAKDQSCDGMHAHCGLLEKNKFILW